MARSPLSAAARIDAEDDDVAGIARQDAAAVRDRNAQSREVVLGDRGRRQRTRLGPVVQVHEVSSFSPTTSWNMPLCRRKSSATPGAWLLPPKRTATRDAAVAHARLAEEQFDAKREHRRVDADPETERQQRADDERAAARQPLERRRAHRATGSRDARSARDPGRLDQRARVPQRGPDGRCARGHLAVERELGLEVLVQPAAAEKLEQEPRMESIGRGRGTAADKRSSSRAAPPAAFARDA